MTGFTKGPWRLAEKSNFSNLIEADSGKSSVFGNINIGSWRAVATYQACCDGNYLDEQENQRANGRLIAAAPDLYEALQAMLEFPNAGPSHDMARAALSKATA